MTHDSAEQLRYCVCPKLILPGKGSGLRNEKLRDCLNAMSKKLINSPVDAVDEFLGGLVAASPGLRRLQGHRVVVRADADQVARDGKVR